MTSTGYCFHTNCPAVLAAVPVFWLSFFCLFFIVVFFCSFFAFIVAVVSANARRFVAVNNFLLSLLLLIVFLYVQIFVCYFCCYFSFPLYFVTNAAFLVSYDDEK